MHNTADIVVIGGGPAGCAAATFTGRCRWKVILIDRSLEAGFLGSLGNVSYYPGFPESISGNEIIKKMRRQAELVGVHIVSDVARAVQIDAQPFKVITDSNKEYEARVVVVATGAAERTNYLHGEREFLGRGVSHDATADGPAVAKRIAAVIGRNRQAAEEALVLARFAEKIHFIIPSSRLDADESLLGQLQKNRSIELYFSTSLKKINGTDHANSITVFSGGQEKEIQVAGVFTYVHEYQPTTGFLEKLVEMAPGGIVKVDMKLKTSADGVFACGDVLCGRPQLPAIASAQGLIAGIGVDRHLSSKT